MIAAFPVTLQLTLASLALACALGIPLGVLAGTRQGSRLDAAVLAGTLFGVSMPIFWLGLMLLILFAAGLNLLPTGGVMPVGQDPPLVTGMSVVDSVLAGDPALIRTALLHLVLPAVTLATIPLALITRVTRAEVIAAGLLDHVRTARAKGLRNRLVVRRHVLRNAAIPILTVVGLQLGLLLSGAVLTETIYSLPGLGAADGGQHIGARLPGGAGGGDVRGRDFRGGELPGRSRLFGARSAGAASLSGAVLPAPQGLVRRALAGKGARLGLALIVLLQFLAAFAALVAPYDPYDQDLSAALTPPGSEHWFGADQFGRGRVQPGSVWDPVRSAGDPGCGRVGAGAGRRDGPGGGLCRGRRRRGDHAVRGRPAGVSLPAVGGW